MKALRKTRGSANGGKSKNAGNHPSKPKRAKRTRSLAPAQLIDILEHINDGLVVLDKDWHYVYVNQKAALMLQRQHPADLIGKHIWTEYPEGVGQPFQRAYEKAMQDQIPVVLEEHYEPWDLWFENRIYPSPDSLMILFTEITARKRTERLLEEREKELSSIYEAVGDVIFQLAVEAEGVYRFTSANQAFFKTTGLSREMLLGKRVDEIIPQPSLDLVLQKYQQAISTRQVVRWEEESQYPTGTLTGEVSLAPVFDDHGLCTHLVGAVHDITERKQVEEALRESEEKFSKVFYASPIPLSINRLSDGRYVEVNESFLKRLGFQREEVLGKNGLEIGAWADPAQGEKMLAILRGAGTLRNFEAQFRTRAGEVGTALLFREVIELAGEKHFIATNLDISERKEMEEALAASETELRALFAAMDDAVMVIDRGGVYRKIAPTNPHLLYKPPEELLGQTLRDVFPTERADRFTETIRRVLETGQTAHIEYELVIDEQVVWFDASISAMDAGNTLWMARDITDRKRVEERLRQLNEELEQRVAVRTEELAAAMGKAQESDRLKSAFLATMSHELRTPLNSIIGFTGVILQGLAGPLNEEQSKQLNMARESAQHLLALINDVLDISKIEAGQLEIVKRPFDMRQAVEQVLRVVQPLLNKKTKLKLKTSLASNVGMIDQDRRRVEQVLINLVNNAIKFTEHGEVSIACQVRDGWLETRVRDSGIGIKPEDLQKLFRPFQQIETGLARSHEGTGLGLSICQHLVTAMGGELSVESEWGAGSMFQFRLPV